LRLKRFVTHPMERVEIEARLLRPWRVRRFHSFGENAIVHRPMWIFGPQQAAIGAHAVLLHGLWLSVEPIAWELPGPVLRLGDRVGIRPHCTLSASEGIVLEDDVMVGAYSTIIDSDHTFRLGQPNIMHNPVETAPVRVGRGTWVGERVAILKGSDIGECCVIGTNSVVRGTIPPYSIAVGAPARVVGRVEGVDARTEAIRAKTY
jgi:acetyltransferase-like isoleucine patch superfamily enzyme